MPRSCCAAGITVSAAVCCVSSASATMRARSRRRSRSAVSQMSSAGSMPLNSSSNSPSSSAKGDGSSVVALSTSSTSVQTSSGRIERWSRETRTMSCPAGCRASRSRCNSWRREARACSSSRRDQSRSASRSRVTGRGAARARMAMSALVLRPTGKTLSPVVAHASIWPMRRIRTATPLRMVRCWGRSRGDPKSLLSINIS